MVSERGTNSLLSRRDALKVAAGAAAAPLVLGRSVGAQGGATPGADEGFFPSPIEGVPNAYYRYPEPFQTVAQTPGSGGTVKLALLSDKRIKGRDENVYWQDLESRLGVTLDVQLWPGAAYAERMATTIAGGDFPDLMHVFTLLYPQATEFQIQGAFADLTQYLDGDARTTWPNLAAFPSYSWENSKVNGVQYGVPNPTSLQPNALWYRSDWLTTAGLAVPTNAAEALAMWQAFAQNDPDGNGAADTYGLSFERLNAIEQRFIHGMFRVLAEGDDFILAPDGSFVHAIETPEFRTSLEYMQQVWASGACHPDSLTQTSNEVREQLIGGSAGSGANAFILFGVIGDEAAKINPNAQIQGLVSPGHDGGEGVAYNIGGWFGQFCIPSSISDEARIEELIRLTDYFAAPFGSEEYTFLTYGQEGVHHTVSDTGARVLTQQGDEEIFNPGLGGLNVLFDANRDRIQYVQEIMAAQTRIGVFSPTVNLYSETASAKAGELGQLYTDRMIEIGTGRAGIDALDDWIADWKSRGGDQMREEYAAAYAAAQG